MRTKRRIQGKPRFKRTWRLGRVEIELRRFINRQCLAVGLLMSWDFRPSVEVALLLWGLRVGLNRKGTKHGR